MYLVKNIKNILAYSDGTNSSKDIAKIIGIKETKVKPLIELLRNKNLILK